MRSDRDLEAAQILRLLDAPTIGPRRVLQLLADVGTAAEATAVLTRSASDRVRDFLASTPLDQYHDIIDRTYALGGDYKLWSDPDYPTNLARWDGRPPVLFFKGDLRGLDTRALALVGRVDPTPEGEAAARRFARKCVEHGISVVSGLAKGIDGASHRGALADPPGRTYAVIAHGLDYAYPKENRDLYDAIPEHGALISQFPVGAGPQRWTFPARNEVMCTLALGTVIVEGKVGCGSLIQADFSFKHGRPVFVLGRNLTAPDSAWAHELLERGAHQIKHFDEVLDVIDATLGESRQPAGTVTEPTLFGSSAATTTTAPVADKRRTRCAVIFDMDGVILDTREATAHALAAIASRYTGSPVDPSTIDPRGKPHRVLEALGVRDAYDVYRKEYDTALLNELSRVQTVSDVVAAISELRSHGAVVALVTSQPRRRVRAMLQPEVAPLFDRVLAYDDTRGKKEAGIRRVLEEFRVRHSDACYVGDQPADLEAAHSAGVKGVGVLWGFADKADLTAVPHDLLLDQPSRIGAALLRSLFAIS